MIDDLWCENHPETKAVGFCAACGKPVCSVCSVSKEDKIFCTDVTHSMLLQEFEKLLTTSTEFEMALIAKNLEANGFVVQWFNPQQYGFNESPRLFVRKSEIHRAVEFLTSLDLLDFTSLTTYDK